MAVEMVVSGLTYDDDTNVPVVWLRARAGEATVPICVGVLEATALAMQIEGIHPDRPLPSDLTCRVIDALAADVERVEVHDLKGAVYHARVMLRAGTETVTLESRPADALALALHYGCSIWVHQHVLAQLAAWAQPSEALPDLDWSAYLETLSDEAFGKYKM